MAGAERLRRAGQLARRVLVPFSAMRRSVELAKNEFERTRGNITAIKELAGQARQTLTEGLNRGETANDSFQDVISRRASNALTLPELEASFLRRKRAALVAAVVFLLLGLYAVIGGIYYDNVRGVWTGIVSIVATQPIFFVIAMGAQFRLWQLRTHRLSREEHGGLEDFKREVDNWIWQTLNPEFRKE